MNITGLTNSTGIVEMGGQLAVLSDGLFGLVILIAIYVITYVTAIRFGSRIAFYTASYVGAIAALLLRIMGWFRQDAILFMAIALAALSAVLAMRSQNQEV